MVKPSTVPEEALETILILVEEGRTPTEIARILNKSGFKRRGGKSFERYHIRTILEGNSKTPQGGTPRVPPLPDSRSKTPPKTPEVMIEPAPTEVRRDTADPWGTIGASPRMRALPSSPPGVTTQTKRERSVERLEELISFTAEEYRNGSAETRADSLQRLLRMLRLFDSILVSAERAEATHAKVAQAIFIINGGNGTSPDGSPAQIPGEEPLPAQFTQEVKAYIEELGGDWSVLLDRLDGEG